MPADQPKTFSHRITVLRDFFLYEAEKLVSNHLNLEKDWRLTNDRPYLMTNDNAARLKTMVETIEILDDLRK